MKKQVLLTLLFFYLGTLFVFSQGPAEKIHLQTDRDYYVPGETVSFNAFVLADIDSVSSRNLFVELWDDSLHKLASITVPLIEGIGSGAISIPRESAASLFFLRAYSDITAPQTQPYQFVKGLNRSALDWPVAVSEAPVFYPEGGSLVNNARNQVLFKAGNDFRGSVRNSKGETIATLNPGFNGMGRFMLTPAKGETYTCYWEAGGHSGSTTLPDAVDIGIALHIRQSPDTLFIDLDNGGSPDPLAHQLKMLLMISNEPAYVVEMNLSKQSRFSYFIPLQDYRAGMAELRVLATDNTVLATRPVFINRHSLTGQPKLELIKKDLSSRGENRVKLQFADTTIRVLSVSVTDAGYSENKGGSGLAATLLSPDGQPVPAAFRAISTPEQMDLAVQVAFSQEPGRDKSPAATALPKGHYLQLEGTVIKGKKPLAEKNLLVGIRSASNGKELYKVKTDDNGKFVIDDLVLFGDVYVHCRIPGNELQELTCTFRLNMPASNQPADLFAAFEQLVRRTAAASSAGGATASSSLKDAADTLAFAEKSITLSEVVLTANSNVQATKRLKALEEKYIAGSVVSGYYATSETLDVLNDPGRVRYTDLFSYMRANLKRVDVRFVKGARQLIYFGRGLTGEMMVDQFYVDNSIVDRNQLDFISLDQIAAIKFVQNLSIERTLPPALAIFLKKPGDEGYWEKDRFQVLEQKLTGYPLSPEFKEPDYRREEIKVEKDLRKTISWKPNTPVEKGMAEIQFYNSDRAKKIRIIAEGITADGSIVYVEKVIE
jgi:hypothetical protein